LGRRIIVYLIAIAALIGLWEVAAVSLQMAAFPTPVIAFAAFLQDLPHGLGRDLAISAWRVSISIVISLVLAVPLGLYLGREEALDRFFAPLIYVTYPIPKIVLLPVIMAMCGLGNFSKIFLIALTIFFQILVTTRDAARQLERPLIDSVTSLGANKWQVYRHVIWPAVLPEILTALRIASGTAIAVLFFAETIASEDGLGYYLMDAWTRCDWADLFAGVIAMSILGLAIYMTLELIERRVCTWKYL